MTPARLGADGSEFLPKLKQPMRLRVLNPIDTLQPRNWKKKKKIYYSETRMNLLKYSISSLQEERYNLSRKTHLSQEYRKTFAWCWQRRWWRHGPKSGGFGGVGVVVIDFALRVCALYPPAWIYKRHVKYTLAPASIDKY
jgi:hypothetical protein